MELRDTGHWLPGWTRGACSIALVVAAGGCFSPDLSGVQCMACPDDVCPGDMVCRNRHCVDPNLATTCPDDSPPPPDGAVGGTSSGSAGADGDGISGGPDSGGTFSAGGSTTGQSGGGSGGTSSAGSGGTPGLTLKLSITETNCTGELVDATAVAENGKSPYRFSIVDGPAGLSLVDDSGHVEVTGKFTTPGTFPVTVQVKDAAGATAKATAIVHVVATPVITTSDLGDVCPGQVVKSKLAAAGGDGRTYHWTADVPGETGLHIQDDELVGRFTKVGNDQDSLDVKLTVESGGCTSDATVTLVELAPASKSCPQIFIMGGVPSLPEPCTNSPYSASFGVKGGETSSYSWSAVTPPGLDFNEGDQSLSGSLVQTDEDAPANQITLQVTAGDRKIEQDFTIPPPRTSCWLAYLAPASGLAGLHFLDPLLKNQHYFPSSGQTAPVLDFKFSPDGKYLVYRMGTSAVDTELALIELATFDEQALGFKGVTHYGWSSDSAALAVSFVNDEGIFLGGVKVSVPPDGGPATYPAFDSVTLAADVNSELVWFAGSSAIGFLDADGSPEVGALGDHGFMLTVHEEDYYDPYIDAYVRSAPNGVFVIPGADIDHTIDFFTADATQPVFHEQARVAPSGHFTARARAHTLEIFGATDDGEIDTHPTLRNAAAGCDALLGWAEGRDRLACAHATDANHAEILVFDALAAPGPTPLPVMLTPITVRGNYNYPSTGTTNLARVFSLDGTEFAFATDNHIYAAHVVQDGTIINLSYPFDTAPDGANAVLAFSPDDHFLLEHRGKSLNLFDLQASPSYPFPLTGTTETLPVAPACDENVFAAAGTYCGESRTRAAFAWSPDSELVAMATPSGAIIVKDLRFAPGISDFQATADCGTDCRTGDKFAFQP